MSRSKVGPDDLGEGEGSSFAPLKDESDAESGKNDDVKDKYFNSINRGDGYENNHDNNNNNNNNNNNMDVTEQANYQQHHQHHIQHGNNFALESESTYGDDDVARKAHVTSSNDANKVKVDNESSGWGPMLSRSVGSMAPLSRMVDLHDLHVFGWRNPMTIFYYFSFMVMLIVLYILQFNSVFNNEFLAPSESNKNSVCNPVPITQDAFYYGDSLGEWSSTSKFNVQKSIYEVDLHSVEIDNENWKLAFDNFDRDMKALSEKALRRDLSWTYVAWASYFSEFSDWKNPQRFSGSVQFMMHANSEIMYTLKQYKSGFASKKGVCSRNAIHGESVAKYNTYSMEDDSACSHVFNMSFYFGGNPLLNDIPFKIGIDTRSITSALAVNLGLLNLKKLTIVDVDVPVNLLQYRHLIKSYYWYIDAYYAPMDPILCFISIHNIPFCLVISLPSANIQDGSYSLYYPITNSFGQRKPNCWTHDQITCPNNDERSDVLDIMLGYVFFPDENDSDDDNIEKIISFGKNMSDFLYRNPDGGDLDLMNHTFYVLQNSILSTYTAYDYGNSDFSSCNKNLTTTLKADFDTFCDGKCSILFAELYRNDIFNPVNKDYYIIRNGSCSNTLYFPDAIKKFKENTPTTLVQSYSICHLSQSQASLQAIGIAYSNANLLSSILLSLMIIFTVYYFNAFILEPGQGLISPVDKINRIRDSVIFILENNKELKKLETSSTHVNKMKARRKTAVVASSGDGRGGIEGRVRGGVVKGNGDRSGPNRSGISPSVGIARNTIVDDDDMP